jgi:acyl carrier protein
MTADVYETVKTLAADVFGVPSSRIGADSTPQTTDNWDSINHVHLVVAIEEQYGVSFTPEEITEMGSVGRIADLLAKKIRT